jgi:hypothetical protein
MPVGVLKVLVPRADSFLLGSESPLGETAFQFLPMNQTLDMDTTINVA